MFRTGGPIKEGLMNGLKDGGPATYMADATMMAGGGMPNMRGRVTGPGGYAGKKESFLKRNYGKLMTAGGAAYNAPEILEMLRFFYKDGGVASLPPMRGMVTGPGKYSQDAMKGFGGALKGDIEQRIKKNPTKAVKPGTYVVPAVKAGVRKYLPSLEGIGGKTMGGIKNLFRKIEMPSKRISTGMPPGTNLSSGQIAAGMATRPATFLERVNMFRKANPRTFYGGLGVGTTSGAIPFALSKGAELAGNIGLQGADLLVSDKYFDQDKVIGGNVKEVFGKVKKALGFEEDKVPPPGEGGAGNVPDAVSGKTKKTQAEIDAEKEALDKQKLDKIYKLLGVDRAKRNAASKALIDMSRYIDEQGADAISKKNIGSTISKAIGAFDKRLDKVDQLKEAAGLMRAKGLIEKDIRSTDNELKELSIRLKNKELNPKFADLKIVAAKTMPGQKGYDSAASAADSDNFRGNIITQSEFSKIIDDVKEKSGELDETVIIKEWTEEKIKGKDLADGNYTVGSSLVTIKDNKVINVAR